MLALYYVIKSLFITAVTALFIGMVHFDLKHFRIKNKYILAVLFSSLCFLLFASLLKILGEPSVFISLKWLIRYFVFLAISTILSLAIWKISIWPAGDSKMHIAASAALPLIIPDSNFFPFLLPLTLAVNIFVPPALAFVANASVSIFRKENKLFSFSTFVSNAKKNMSAILGAIMIFLICRYVNELIKSYLYFSPIFQFVFIFLAWPLLKKKLFKNIKVILPVLAMLIVFGCFTFSSAKALESLATSIIYSGVLMALRFLSAFLVEQNAIELLRADQIRSGLILDPEYRKIIKKSNPQFYDKYLHNQNYPEGLTALQAEALKNLICDCQNSGDSSLAKICSVRYKAFSEWIAFGLMLSCLLNGNHVITLFKYFIMMLKRIY